MVATAIGVVVAEPIKHYGKRFLTLLDSLFSERVVYVDFPRWYAGDIEDLLVTVYPLTETPDFRSGVSFPARDTVLTMSNDLPNTHFKIAASFPSRTGRMTYISRAYTSPEFPIVLSLPDRDLWTHQILTSAPVLTGRSIVGIERSDPVWLEIVEGELAFWSDPNVTEISDLGRDRVINHYFGATEFNPVGMQAWGCAFLSWVIQQSESLTEVYPNPKSVRCADWNDYGAALNEPVVGAIANFVPFIDEAISGFGGFITGFDDETITIIGGNIFDSVSVAVYPRERITSVRWPGVLEAD